MTDDEEIRLGHQARHELNVTAQAFAHLRAVMLEEIATSRPEQTDRRERLYQGLQVLEGVKTALTRAVSGGDAAAARQAVNEEIAE